MLLPLMLVLLLLNKEKLPMLLGLDLEMTGMLGKVLAL